MKAKLIGERSAGMTAVEIYDDAGQLIWSHRWFDRGCGNPGYVDGLIDVYECMENCIDVAYYNDGDVDDDGAPVPYDDSDSTGVMLEYDTSTGWQLGEDTRRLGNQSSELVDACMLAGLIPADDEHAEHADDAIVKAIAAHIMARPV